MATQRRDRPELRHVPLDEVFLMGRAGVPVIVVTISIGQPMGIFHQVGYDEGAYLVELDDDEQPVRAYHRGGDRRMH